MVSFSPLSLCLRVTHLFCSSAYLIRLCISENKPKRILKTKGVIHLSDSTSMAASVCRCWTLEPQKIISYIYQILGYDCWYCLLMQYDVISVEATLFSFSLLLRSSELRRVAIIGLIWWEIHKIPLIVAYRFLSSIYVLVLCRILALDWSVHVTYPLIVNLSTLWGIHRWLLYT